MALVRLPIDREGLHCIPLYQETVVVAAGADHVIGAAEEISLADLDEEQLVAAHRSSWTPTTPQLDWPPMTPRETIETVAAGTGVVLIPMSIARLYARKDVIWRPVPELEPTTVGLSWLVENEDPRVQDFIGIVRGRTANSSRR